MNTDHEKIQKGFNDGYLIAKHKPDVFSTLQKGLVKGHEDSYVEGLRAGARQFELDNSLNKEKKSQETSREELRKKIRENIKQQDKDNDRDRGR